MTTVDGIGNFGGFGGGYSSDPYGMFAVGALAAGHGAYGAAGFGFDYGDFHTLESLGDVKASIKDSQAEIAQGLHSQAMFALKSDGDTDRRIAKTEADIRSDIKENKFDLTNEINEVKALISDKFNDLERRELQRELADAKRALGAAQNASVINSGINLTAERVIELLRIGGVIPASE